MTSSQLDATHKDPSSKPSPWHPLIQGRHMPSLRVSPPYLAQGGHADHCPSFPRSSDLALQLSTQAASMLRTGPSDKAHRHPCLSPCVLSASSLSTTESLFLSCDPRLLFSKGLPSLSCPFRQELWRGSRWCVRLTSSRCWTCCRTCEALCLSR